MTRLDMFDQKYVCCIEQITIGSSGGIIRDDIAGLPLGTKPKYEWGCPVCGREWHGMPGTWVLSGHQGGNNG